MNFIAVFIGGGLGSVARYSVGLLVSQLNGQPPWTTLISNVLATILLMYFLAIFQPGDEAMNPKSRALFLLLTIGFCGGFSTFSTFAMDTIQLWNAQGWLWAGMNVVSNLLLCVGLGYWIWHLTHGTAH
ncbi:MAG: CrcB family protein [Bacteroidetes bacterium]|nr:CrcB family protein [Bacteroidota bacterium]MDA1336665.1 CrcB family protein [Bacteroidota bacterium]